jgi:hypothetical protein
MNVPAKKSLADSLVQLSPNLIGMGFDYGDLCFNPSS